MKLLTALVFSILIFSFGADAQTKKKPAAKQPVAKKKESGKKDVKKVEAKNSPNSKKSVKTAANTKQTTSKKVNSRTADKKAQTTSKKADPKNAKNAPKKQAESKKAALERKIREEERRQAILAEQRRREQAAREARERKLAFERGLRTETVANIETDVVQGEDLTVRRAAINALGNHAGTVVVMEAKTGRLVTVVNQDWAVKKGFKPCSTIKLVTGVAGLNEEVINSEGGVGESTSGMKLETALARSDNGYFQRVGTKFGNAKMIEYAKKLGLGEPTGVNSEGETAGRLPHGNRNPRIYSHGDDFEVTPLQLAVMVSAISNGGKKVVPRFERPRVEKTSYSRKSSSKVEVPQNKVEGVLPGMVGAAEFGTARRGVDATMGVAGKTGSCIGGGSWVGLFASVAPVEDPKYAVVVITRGQNERGRIAATIAGQIYNVLRPRISRNPDSYWAKRSVKTVTPAHQQTAGLPSDEESDELDTQETDAKLPPIVVGKGASQPATKKLVQKTVQSKPAFPPVVITVNKDKNKEKVKKETTARPRVVKN